MAKHRSRRMLAGGALVFVAAWAVVAIVLLSLTLSSANSINGNAARIKRRLAHTEASLDYLPLADRAARTATAISRAASALSGELRQVNANVAGIDQRSRSILFTAARIDQDVWAIDSTARAIHGHVNSIDGRVHSIHAHARGILGTVRATDGHALSILASVRGIKGRLTRVSGTAAQIDRRTATISRQAGNLLDLGHSIDGSLANVLSEVGLDHGTPLDATIYGHANSIDCRVLGPRCGQ